MTEEDIEPKCTCEELTELEAHKKRKFGRIDIRTQNLIREGFVFDSTTFSLSHAAQLNWESIHSNKDLYDSQGYFPMGISTKDNGEYSLTYANVTPFYLTAVGVVKAIYDGGRALKLQVSAATTIEEVEAIEDTR